jgi:hypothetical protein
MRTRTILLVLLQLAILAIIVLLYLIVLSRGQIVHGRVL